ncbi:MAG: PIN domain-containing protein [Eggerthellaceae bacterium]|nr:PIN domain-containing protein [Eggerthellaceae bacterium]
MTDPLSLTTSSPRVVFADANVLYARVLRDYLLYSAAEGIIDIVWSRKVLDEMAEHLVMNIPSLTRGKAELLVARMTNFYPDAEINPEESDYRLLAEYRLPDENDRHIFVAALVAEANIICTSNKKDFPEEVASRFGITVLSPDELLCRMVELEPAKMHIVHSNVVKFYPGGTNEGTLAALNKAGAMIASSMLKKLI